MIPIGQKELSVPPLEHLTMMLFGIPGSGKTTLASYAPNTFFLASEPGQDYVRANSEFCENWMKFQQLCQGLVQLKEKGKCPYHTVALDIIDNFYEMALQYVCSGNKIDYPRKDNFGADWAEIKKMFVVWLRYLMSHFSVIFITHEKKVTIEILLDNGMKHEVDQCTPTFSGNKAAQYIDGIVNAVGHCTVYANNKYSLDFRQSGYSAAKDRTNVLASLGNIELPNTDPFAHVSNLYKAKAIELGYKVQ